MVRFHCAHVSLSRASATTLGEALSRSLALSLSRALALSNSPSLYTKLPSAWRHKLISSQAQEQPRKPSG
eukprot:5606842-Pleurochrysis_carterae.AAC.1